MKNIVYIFLFLFQILNSENLVEQVKPMTTSEKLLKNILEKHNVSNINNFVQYDLTPLIIAVQNSYYDEIKVLLEYGAKVGIVSKISKTTAIIEACFLEKYSWAIDLINILMKQVANDSTIQDKTGFVFVEEILKQKNNKDYSALLYALENCSCDIDKNREFELIKLLLDNGADINDLKPISNRTLLMLACEKNRFDIVELLLKKISNYYNYNENINQIAEFINKKDINGQDALFIACSVGNVGIVNLLLENGADINSKDKIGLTALHIACYNGHGEVVSFLINFFIKKNPKNKDLLFDFLNKRCEKFIDFTPREAAGKRNKNHCIKILDEYEKN